VTEALSASTLAVPMFRGMTAADVDRVVDCLVGGGRNRATIDG
jgi:dTDP-4-amino-4,6-dideoxygalactose transaminase